MAIQAYIKLEKQFIKKLNKKMYFILDFFWFWWYNIYTIRKVKN